MKLCDTWRKPSLYTTWSSGGKISAHVKHITSEKTQAQLSLSLKPPPNPLARSFIVMTRWSRFWGILERMSLVRTSQQWFRQPLGRCIINLLRGISRRPNPESLITREKTLRSIKMATCNLLLHWWRYFLSWWKDWFLWVLCNWRIKLRKCSRLNRSLRLATATI